MEIIYTFIKIGNKSLLGEMKTGMHYSASKTIFQFAKALRKNMTESEKIVWERVCNNQLGVRIRRQHPITNYIADYYCHELKLVIEVDGGIHLSQENKQNDKIREAGLNEYGIEIIRFTNEEVSNEIDIVIEKILLKINELKKKQIGHGLLEELESKSKRKKLRMKK